MRRLATDRERSHKRRLSGKNIKILGLTGSIGMGKSEAAKMLRQMGVPVFEADREVHRLLAGPAVEVVAKLFPDCISKGVVDRQALGRKIFADTSAKQRLEAVLHPLVRQAEKAFVRNAAQQRKPLVVLDIPLLFETGGDARCDAVVVVSAPPAVQRARVLARPGMSTEKLEAILKTQLPDVEKRRRADHVLHSGHGKRHTRDQLAKLLKLYN